MPLTDAQKLQIAAEARARCSQVTFPDALAGWLGANVQGFLDTVDPSQRNQHTEGEIAAVAVAAGYGPDTGQPLPEPVLANLIGVAQFAHPGDQRAIERLLVRGCLLPPSPPPTGADPWQCRWDRAWECLFHLICRVITDAVRWVGHRVMGLVGNALADWAHGELDEETGSRPVGQVDSCAAVIRGALVLGCDCWQRWQDMRIQNEALAMCHCETRHRLSAWDGQQALDLFLFRAAVLGPLRLPDPDAGITELARVNDFRCGMLAKDVAEAMLVAGPVLRCSQPGCDGEIRLNDHCDHCGQLAHVQNPSWWLWLRDERQPWPCRRCGPCNCLYFQWWGPCPGCGVHDWGHTPTQVWVPVGWVSMTDHFPSDGPGSAEGLESSEDREKLLAAISNWSDGPHKRVAQRIFRDGWTLTDAAGEQELVPEASAFKKLVAEIINRLGGEPGVKD